MIARLFKRIPASLFIAVFLGILFTLFTLFPIRIDLSNGHAYTLATSTKNIVRSLKKQVTITLYSSSDLPTRILPLKNDVTQLLAEYNRAGNVKVEVVDPKTDTKIAEQAKTAGIPQLQYSQLEQNKYQTASFYFGMVIAYDGKTEIIPQVSDYTNLEYNVTSAIYRLTRKDMPKVAIIGEDAQYANTQNDPLMTFKTALSKQYSVVSVDPTTLTTKKDTLMSGGYQTAIVMDNGQTKYSSEEIASLKDYFESGKNIIVLAGGEWINPQLLSVTTADHNLNELTATYGAQLNDNLVLSTAAEYVNFGNAQMQFLAPYPFWLRTNAFNKNTGLFANIQYVMFPWGSSLTLSPKKDVTLTNLIMTSDRSWEQKGTFELNPNNIPQPIASQLQSYDMGVLIKHKKGGQMAVIGSSNFVSDQYIGRQSGNIDFMLNLVDSLSSQGALNGIRSRAVSFYPIPDMSDTMKLVYEYGALLLFPVLWGVYGAIRLIKRNK